MSACMRRALGGSGGSVSLQHLFQPAAALLPSRALCTSRAPRVSRAVEENRKQLGLLPQYDKKQSISVRGAQSETERAVEKMHLREHRKLVGGIMNAALARDWETALQWFQQMTTPDPYVYSAIFHAADRCNRYAEAMHLHSELKAAGLPRSPATMTPLIRLAGRSRQLRNVDSLWNDMEASGIEQNHVTYSAYIDAHRRCRNHAGAMAFWKRFKESDPPVGPVTPPLLTTILRAAAETGDIARTEELLSEAVDFKLECVHMNCVLEACKKASDADAARRVLKQMIRDGPSPDVISFTEVLQTLHRSQGTQAEAKEVYELMRSAGVAPDRYFIEAQVCFLLRRDFAALQLGRAPSDSLLTREEVTEALQLLDDAKAQGISTTKAMDAFQAAAKQSLQEDWVELATPAESTYPGGPSVYYWERSSNRTQWIRPSTLLAIPRVE